MRKYILCCILCLMPALLFTGCKKADRVETDEKIRIPSEADEDALGEAAELYEAVENENLESRGEIVTSEDGVYHVLIPSGWELCENKIDETMLFEIQGETEDQYMGILVIDKDVYGQFDSAAYMDAYAQMADEQYEDAIVGQKKEVDINGTPAYLLKIAGTIDDIMYMNLVYGVDYEDEIVIFTASTYTEHASAVTEDLYDVVVSFGRITEDLPPVDTEEISEESNGEITEAASEE